MNETFTLSEEEVFKSNESGSSPEIITVEELAHLPEGICIKADNPDETSIEALGEFIVEDVLNDENDRFSSSFREKVLKERNNPIHYRACNS